MRGIKIRKPIIKLFILISIIAVISYLMYLIGYLPVIGNIIAEKKLSNYSTIQKGNTQKVETKYDWYNTKYQSVKGKLTYRLKKNTIFDEKFSKEVKQIFDNPEKSIQTILDELYNEIQYTLDISK